MNALQKVIIQNNISQTSLLAKKLSKYNKYKHTQQAQTLDQPYLKRDLETISNMPGHTEKDFREDTAKILKNANWRVQSHEFILMPNPADHIDPNDQASIRRFRNYCQIFINECFNGHFETSSRYKNKNGKFRYRFRYKRPNNDSTNRFYWMLDIQPDSSQNSRVHAHIMVINRDLKTGNAMSANYYGIQHVRKAIHHATEDFNNQSEIQNKPSLQISDIVHHKKGRRATKNAQVIITALNQILSSVRVKGIKTLGNKLKDKNIEMVHVSPAKKRKHHGFKFRLLTKKVSRKHKVRTVKHRWIWSSRLCKFAGAEKYNMDGIKLILSKHRQKFSYRKHHHLPIDEPAQLSAASKKPADVSQQSGMELSVSTRNSSSDVKSSNKSSSSSMPSQVSTEMTRTSQILSEIANVNSFKRSCSHSASQAFKHAKQSITDNRSTNSFVHKRINQIKSHSSNDVENLEPEWKSVTSSLKRYKKKVQSRKAAESSEAQRVTRIMPKLRKRIAYQFSYWYYQNIPQILEGEFKGYNKYGIPRFGINKKNYSWFHDLVSPIIKGFKNSEKWISQKWRSGKRAIANWMDKNYISRDTRYRDNYGDPYTREFYLSDIEDFYNSGIIHKAALHLPKYQRQQRQRHALVKRTDKMLQKYHTAQDFIRPEIVPREVSNKMYELKSEVRSASSASASHSKSISEQIAWSLSAMSNINNKNNIANSLRSASTSAKKAYSANVISFEANTPITKKVTGCSSANVTNSTAGLVLSNVNKNLQKDPLLKKYAKDLGIDTIKSSLTTRSSKHTELVRSKSADNFFKSSRSKFNKRSEKHQKERRSGYRYFSSHNPESEIDR